MEKVWLWWNRLSEKEQEAFLKRIYDMPIEDLGIREGKEGY